MSMLWSVPFVVARRRSTPMVHAASVATAGPAGLPSMAAGRERLQAVYSFSLFWKPLGQGSGQDPSFGCDLWYMTPCMGHLLWAFNEEHLRFLRSYVSVSLRQRDPGRNASLASRLPGWMLSGKNRAEVLKCIDRLLAKAPI